MTSRPTEQHLEEATVWLLRLRDGETAALRARHRAWLAERPEHDLAWRQVGSAWGLLGQAGSDLPAAAAADSVLPLPRAAPPRRRLWIAAAMAACLLLAVAPALVQRLSADATTATGEQRRLTLADGSVVRMAPETAIALDVSESGRGVELLKGRAFFEVAPDPARPFTVRAGGGAVTVLGTAFDVGLSDAALDVTVRSGAVGVRYPGAGQAVDVQLGPGDRMEIDRPSGAATAGHVDPATVAPWLDGRLFVANRPLSDAIAALRPYMRGWIIVTDATLAARRVTGLYNLQAPDAALQAMLQPAGGTVRQVTPFLRIVTSGAP
ncbi:FecR domain-containing protein [Ferrovibrio sp.]|uniref:FecR family protein n=1 Tax=Ferrovibrio sp. TaxID=1917215 RepID=UPI00351109D8